MTIRSRQNKKENIQFGLFECIPKDIGENNLCSTGKDIVYRKFYIKPIIRDRPSKSLVLLSRGEGGLKIRGKKYVERRVFYNGQKESICCREFTRKI